MGYIKKKGIRRSKLTLEPIEYIPRLKVYRINGAIIIEGKYRGHHLRHMIPGIDVEKLGPTVAFMEWLGKMIAKQTLNKNMYLFIAKVVYKHRNEIVDALKRGIEYEVRE